MLTAGMAVVTQCPELGASVEIHSYGNDERSLDGSW